jgi:hypothetical protein
MPQGVRFIRMSNLQYSRLIKGLPTICKASGKPVVVKPQGTVKAGWPVD